MRKRRNKGFTILELLVVVAIIGILAVIALPNFIGRLDEAKDSRELAEIDTVTKAVNMYYADKGVYPTLQGKDVALTQAQPIDGAPHNVDFSVLVPDYLATLPHFSYWWVDYQGKVYHTEQTIGNLAGSIFTPTAGYTYTLYKANGTTQVLSAPYTLLAGEYVVGKDDTGVSLPKISTSFKNALMHPEDPAYVVKPVVKDRYLVVEVQGHYGSNGATIAEIEVRDASNALLPYTVVACYDKVTMSQPTYWDSSNCWDKTNLSDGSTSYTSNLTGSYSNSLFLWDSVATTTHYARVVLDLGVCDIKTVNIWAGSPEIRIPKFIKVYSAETYAYTANLVNRLDTNLNLIGQLNFTGSETTVAKYTLTK